MYPSGEQYDLAGHGYEATVTQVGGGLRRLEHAGIPLVVPFANGELRPRYRGSLLAPWPNRIRDGRYDFRGRTLQLDLSEPERGNALHGLVCWQPWTLIDRAVGRVVLGTRVWPQPGYPFMLDLEAAWALSADGLACRLIATNAGDSAAPFGWAPHPYLVAGAGRVDDWVVDVPAEQVLEVDPDRKLPTSLRDLDGDILDLRGGVPLRGREIDHAYTALRRADDASATVTVRGADGSGVAMVFGNSFPWVQVHTGDRPEPEHHRIGLAVEPMTCPPDAFRSGVDLTVIDPGLSVGGNWTLGVLPRR